MLSLNARLASALAIHVNSDRIACLQPYQAGALALPAQRVEHVRMPRHDDMLGVPSRRASSIFARAFVPRLYFVVRATKHQRRHRQANTNTEGSDGRYGIHAPMRKRMGRYAQYCSTSTPMPAANTRAQRYAGYASQAD